MFKKLQNLLFDDEELNEEEDIEEVEEVKEEPVRKKTSAPAAEAAPAMARIDVTQPIQTIRESVPSQASTTVKPAVQHASPKPLNTVETPAVPQPVKPSLGITVDEPVVNKQKSTMVRNSKQSVKKPASKPTNGNLYEFRPVISPIFGVDEKNAETIQAVRKSATLDRDGAGSEVLSPIYGVKDYSGKSEVKEESKPVRMERKVSSASRPVEREVPEFSLDDILNAREEEYKKEAATGEVIDETTVIDPTLAPFGNIKKEKDGK